MDHEPKSKAFNLHSNLIQPRHHFADPTPAGVLSSVPYSLRPAPQLVHITLGAYVFPAATTSSRGKIMWNKIDRPNAFVPCFSWIFSKYAPTGAVNHSARIKVWLGSRDKESSVPARGKVSGAGKTLNDRAGEGSRDLGLANFKTTWRITLVIIKLIGDEPCGLWPFTVLFWYNLSC
jgi:hypothetical protein